MSITRFFRWPTTMGWLEARSERIYELMALDRAEHSTARAALLEVLLNGYALRRVR